MLKQLTPTTLLIGVCLFASTNGMLSSWVEHPYFVSLNYKDSGENVCSGALVDSRAVIVAASCLSRHPNARAKNLVAKASPRLFRNFNIRNIVVHPKYDPATNDNDVAIAYLRKPIFSPLQLGIMGSPFTSKHLNLGIVVNNSTVTEVIFHEKDVLNMRLLSTVQSGSSCDSSHATVCAISVEPDNQCPTNKGGPVVNLFTESLVGISSFNPDKECNPGEAEGFTRIDLYRLWIDAEITKLPLININDYASKAFNYIGK